ncbi:MAG: hypothetical protein ACXWXC_12720, partial [Aeromicrobium sp.]
LMFYLRFPSSFSTPPDNQREHGPIVTHFTESASLHSLRDRATPIRRQAKTPAVKAAWSAVSVN